MKKVLFSCLFLFFSFAAIGQSKAEKPNATTDAQGNYIAIPREKSGNDAPINTGKTYTDSKGKVYPVYKTKAGKLYINRISGKTGKEYRYYLRVK